MKLRKWFYRHLTTAFVVVSVLTSGASNANAEQETVTERVFHSRAIEAVVWAMPMLNFKGFRDALIEAGAGPNDVTYFSKVQDWRFQTATPNNTTPYINFFWNMSEGPIVVEIPASTPDVGVFGTLMDTWQRPIDDVGAFGRDGGKGAKYLLLPKGYDGPLLPGALVYEQRTNNGFAILRPIIADSSPESLAKATEYTKQIKVYPLSEADNPSETKYVDTADTMLEMTPVLDGGVYAEIHQLLQEEPVEDQNLAIMGMLARIGLYKNRPFAPDEKTQAVFDTAAPEALEYMIEQYHRAYNPQFYENRLWSGIVPNGVTETDFSYEYPSYFDYDLKGVVYYGIISSAKNYGAATFYLDLAEDQDGEWLNGGKNYKLTVPANVPVRDFWSITTYDLQTAAFVRDVPRNTIDSNLDDVKKNDDGSVDIYIGRDAPEGMKSNWLPTDPERRFFLLSRFYGPEPGLFDGSFVMNDIERIE